VVPAVVALSFPNRLEDQDGVRLMVKAQAGEVGKARVGAEAVVAVVGADLQGAGRNDQAFTFELVGDGLAPGRGVRGHGVAGREFLAGRRPVAGHKGLEGVGTGPLGAVVDALVQGLGSRIGGVIGIVHGTIVSPARRLVRIPA
jgi:hypothetical protein